MTLEYRNAVEFAKKVPSSRLPHILQHYILDRTTITDARTIAAELQESSDRQEVAIGDALLSLIDGTRTRASDMLATSGLSLGGSGHLRASAADTPVSAAQTRA